ncbi:MAG: hypothetical protein RMK29_14320 [Myxococcales bacterium]|nr:hypothetical protein [Myxococcota bacterium]MDW8282887.1 hypothetical protein [Myxococcales bacterium]
MLPSGLLPRLPEGLDRLVTQLAEQRCLDRERVREALLSDPQFRLLCQHEGELRAARSRGESHPGLLRIAFLMAEAADRVARQLAG